MTIEAFGEALPVKPYHDTVFMAIKIKIFVKMGVHCQDIVAFILCVA